MKRLATVMLLASLLVSLLIVAPVAHASTNVSWQLGMALDGSGSISSTEFAMMLEGIASSVQDANIVPQDGTVEICVVQFAGRNSNNPAVWASVEVPCTTIASQTDADTVAAAIRAIHQGGGVTPLAAGINLVVKTMKYEADGVTVRETWNNALWHVINISTDGVPNRPCDPNGQNCTATAQAAAEAAMISAAAEGIDECDAEAVGFTTAALQWMAGISGGTGIVYPSPGCIVNNPTEYPPRPPDPEWCSFVRACDTFQDYQDAITEKFLILRVITLEPPESENPLRSNHTVTATLTRLDASMQGEVIDFEIIDGPNQEKAGQGTTDGNGQCTWTYADDSALAWETDIIRASNTYAGHTVFSQTVTKTWTPEPVDLELTPATSENCMGTSHTVHARLTDINEQGITGGLIDFEVIDGPNAGKSGIAMTNGGGLAHWTYTDDSASGGEVDTIQASHQFDSTTLVSDQVTKTWKDCSSPNNNFPGMSFWGVMAAVIAMAALAVLSLRRRSAYQTQ